MSLSDWAGTGLSLDELSTKLRHERNRILAEVLAAHLTKRTRLDELIREAESALRNDMLSIEATVADAGAYEVKLTPKRKYTYDAEVLSGLQAFVDPDTYDMAVQPVPATVRVNKAELNKLAKRGGRVAQIIAEGTTTEVTAYDVDLVKKKVAVTR